MNDLLRYASPEPGASESAPRPPSIRGFLDLVEGHFPGHTMQRVRTPEGRYRYTYVSPGVKQTFGLDPERLLAQDAVQHEWVHGEDRDRFLGALERSAETLETLDVEVRVKVPDGRFKWVRSIGHPRRLADGTVVWDGVALDVTDRREALEALERSLTAARRQETSVARFAAIAAQDISVPFRRLQDEVEALAAEGEAPERLARALSDLEQTMETAFGLLGVAWPGGRRGGRRSEQNMEDGAPSPVEGLTRRQREILALVGAGLSNRGIAERTGLTEGTVKLHVSNILKRLGARNRTEAARLIGGPQT